MLKLALPQSLLQLPKTNRELRRQLGVMEQERDRLRGKLAALQQEHTALVKQADGLRRDKERMRAQLKSLRSSLGQQTKVNEQLAAKLAELCDLADEESAN